MEQLFLYRLTPKKEAYFHGGYDTYDSLIVCAASKEEAAAIHPNDYMINDYSVVKSWFGMTRCWVNSPNEVEVSLIGIAVDQKKGIILSSFNAG